MPRRELAVTARLLAAAIVLSGAPAANAAGARRPEAQEAPVRSFDRDADATRRRAKELTDSLKIRGKFPFLELLGFRANYEGDADKAQEAFAGMIEAAPDNPRGYFHLASNLFIGGN
ncbi:MAG: hypothetical protein HYV15_01600 [Elusimicrobia bacterium]|nr:hypothetical protein [Elusimicrobiota bacterium]